MFCIYFCSTTSIYIVQLFIPLHLLTTPAPPCSPLLTYCSPTRSRLVSHLLTSCSPSYCSPNDHLQLINAHVMHTLALLTPCILPAPPCSPPPCSLTAHPLLTPCSPTAHLLLTSCSLPAHPLLTYCSPTAHFLLTSCSPPALLLLTSCLPPAGPLRNAHSCSFSTYLLLAYTLHICPHCITLHLIIHPKIKSCQPWRSLDAHRPISN